MKDGSLYQWKTSEGLTKVLPINFFNASYKDLEKTPSNLFTLHAMSFIYNNAPILDMMRPLRNSVILRFCSFWMYLLLPFDGILCF